MVQIEGNRMISQSLKDIRLWDLENANCVLSIPTSTYSAESGRCFQFQGTRNTHTHTRHDTTGTHGLGNQCYKELAHD